MTEAHSVIGRIEEDGRPVIYRYVDETPSDDERSGLPWLSVLTWTYDGSSRLQVSARSDGRDREDRVVRSGSEGEAQSPPEP